jgi:hypothetical protein
MLIGGAMGVASTVGVSYAQGVNPWTGRSLSPRPPPNYNFTPDPYGDNVTLYRGTTGSESGGGSLFMTDNPEYAASYVKNGGRVVKATIPRSTYLLMQQNGHIQTYQGIHMGLYGLEYQIHPSIAPQVVKLLK